MWLSAMCESTFKNVVVKTKLYASIYNILYLCLILYKRIQISYFENYLVSLYFSLSILYIYIYIHRSDIERDTMSINSIIHINYTSVSQTLFLELWTQSTPSLPLLPSPLWSRVVVLVKFLSMGQIELVSWVRHKNVFDDKALDLEFWKCGVPLHYHYFQFYSDLEW